MKCQVCNVPWQDHTGPTAMCAKIRKLEVEMSNAREEVAHLQADKAKILAEQPSLADLARRLEAIERRLVDLDRIPQLSESWVNCGFENEYLLDA